MKRLNVINGKRQKRKKAQIVENKAKQKQLADDQNIYIYIKEEE